MFGLTEEQVAAFGMTFGIAAFMLYMLFVIGELAWKSKAGKAGTVVLSLLSFGMLGFVGQVCHSKSLGDVIMSQFDNVSVVKKANVFRRQVRQSFRQFADGTKKTVGVILPASLTFTFSVPEIMEGVGGACKD